MDNKIQRALEVAEGYGPIDGGHHKMWVIDQMIRELTGCPEVPKQGVDCNGKKYSYNSLGESKEYIDWVAKHNEWDIGIAP